ncbi:MAG: radical SAM protein [Alphaproteobacteria bacterium]|uniref:Radical SAM protein n=1 Tax=Candidatus Nitrobium versatile TaxID=2884831 RepID=A0A953J6T1_9BACT|nr:radical SAM protein [Candidatus Nitrobium versatile]
MKFVTIEHEIGRLSKSGVLDVGLKCPHSCEFCYYSYLDKTGNQFRGIRRAPFRPLKECKRALDFFVTQGFERLDITGGEPTYHPHIIDIVKYAEKEKNLRVRIITLGQLLDRKIDGTGRKLLNALIEDAEITDFLFSLHAVDPNLFYRITKGNFEKLEDVMDRLDAVGFDYCTNTVVYANNAWNIPDIAKYIVSKKRRVRICNFITMNAYYAWSTGKAFGIQARYKDIIDPIRKATTLLEDAGIAVNIRYGTYCAIKGLEKNFVGCVGVLFDPYEWRNTTQNPFDVIGTDEEDAFTLSRRKLPLNNKAFPEKCKLCSVKEICDGVDVAYYAKYGDEEIQPFNGPPIDDVVYFRRNNKAAFNMKQKASDNGTLLLPQFENEPLVSEQLKFSDNIKSIFLGIRKFYANKFFRRLYLSEAPKRNLSEKPPLWTDAHELNGTVNQALTLPRGARIQFSIDISKGSIFYSKVRLLKDGSPVSSKKERSFSAKYLIEAKDERSDLHLLRMKSVQGGNWMVIKQPLPSKCGERVDLIISHDDSGEEGVEIVFIEPIIYSRKSLFYILNFIYRRARYLGMRRVYKKLLSYAHYGARESRPD